jgi:AraC-like DNA-binding protein
VVVGVDDRDRELAAHLTAEAFAAALAALPRYRPQRSGALAWLFTIADRPEISFGLLGKHYADIVTPEEIANLAHLRRARDLIDREYARPLDVAALARAALMSSAHFSRRFRATYGETPYAYLMTRRIERAKALLRLGELSVTEVCMAVGCTSLGSFSARFTQLVGQTPTAYRARDHSALASVPGCVAKDLTRPNSKPSRIGEARQALAH